MFLEHVWTWGENCLLALMSAAISPARRYFQPPLRSVRLPRTPAECGMLAVSGSGAAGEDALSLILTHTVIHLSASLHPKSCHWR